MTTDKLILDACCGSRMFWFDKNNPAALFADVRIESHILCDGRALEISPDIQMDFTKMPFADESFHLVVFDPPHLIKLGSKTWMAKKWLLAQSRSGGGMSLHKVHRRVPSGLADEFAQSTPAKRQHG